MKKKQSVGASNFGWKKRRKSMDDGMNGRQQKYLRCIILQEWTQLWPILLAFTNLLLPCQSIIDVLINVYILDKLLLWLMWMDTDGGCGQGIRGLTICWPHIKLIGFFVLCVRACPAVAAVCSQSSQSVNPFNQLIKKSTTVASSRCFFCCWLCVFPVLQ